MRVLSVLLVVSCSAEGVYSVSGGRYLVVEPPRGAEPMPALVMLHGHRGVPTTFTEDAETLAAAAAAGVLLVAPVGEDKLWSAPHSPQEDGRDDVAFLAAVLDDVSERWPVSSVWLGGSSQGAAMAASHAVLSGMKLDGLVALSGGFWDPIPSECPASSPPVTHSHGEADTTWPLSGRTLYGSYTQSAIADDIDYWLACAQCEDTPEVVEDGPLTCTVWSSCASGGPVRFCVHDGGHGRRAGWAERQLGWLQSL